MNCFYHNNTVAIGTSKACAKGLCIDCQTDLEHGIACKNKHEQEVKDLNMVISKNIKSFANARTNMFIAPIFYFFMGLVFVIYPLYRGGSIIGFPVILGAGFIIFSIFMLVANWKIFRNNKNKPQ